MGRPTVHDIAKEAGVSLATVDRVLNARPGVRDKTITKVNDAVKRLGYVRDTYAANLARQRQYRFAFVLPEGSGQFATALGDALREVSSSQVADRTELRIVRVSTQDPHAIVRALRSLERHRLDGLALMVPETPQVRDAVSRLKDAGLAVVTLVSDLPNSQRDFFVGINSVAAGRTAALLMGRFVKAPGEVLVVANSLRSRDSLERRLGFDTVLSNDFRDLVALPTIEWHGDHQRMERVIKTAISSRTRLVGVYSMGSGNKTLISTIRNSGQLGDLVVLAHELTPAMRLALQENEVAAIIAQNVGHLVRSALRVLRSVSDDLPIFESQERLRIEVVLRENLP